MTPNDLAHVAKLEISLLGPEVRRDASRVGQLLAEDFTEIGASGRLWRRDEIIAALVTESGGGPQALVDEMTARALTSDVVLLTFRTAMGDRVASRSSVWRRTPGGWRLEHHHGTLAPPSA